MIDRRLVCLFPGFEPMRGDAHLRRFRRGAESAAALWGLTIGIEEPPIAPGEAELFRQMKIRLGGEAGDGDHWKTDTEIVLFDWGDLILAYAARPAWRRFVDGYHGLADFLFTGTVFRYFKVSWRYGLFYLFPVVLLLGAIALAALAGALVGQIGGLVGALLGLVLGIAIFAGLMFLATKRVHLLTALDDWAMARDICHGSNPVIRTRIALQAQELSRRFSAFGTRPKTEIVVAAHSLGAVMAVMALAETFSRPQDIGSNVKPPRPHTLTVGSSLLKTALHPAARDERAAVRTLVVEQALPWTDCQGLSDPINFYKSNPATSLGIDNGRTPRVIKLSFKRMVKPETYKRIKRDFFRLHRQFVLPVERRGNYSFHMLLLGPNRVADFAYEKSVDQPPLKPLPDAPKEVSDVKQASEAGR